MLLLLMVVIISCSAQEKIIADRYNPVTVTARSLPGKLSHYNVYTEDWFSKAMDVTRNIRGLDFDKKLSYYSITKKELGEYIGINPEFIRNKAIIENFYIQMGYADEGFTLDSLFTTESEDAETSIGGFYSIGEYEFVMVEDAVPRYNPYRPVRYIDIIVVHELTHALQDINFSLRSAVRTHSENTDSMMALRSLLEGDATLTQYLFFINENPYFSKLTQDEKDTYIRRLSERMSSFGYGRMIEDSAVPSFWIKGEVFIYLNGAGFVSQLYLADGFDAVNRAYEYLPASTEHILHPMKYINKDMPSEIDIPELSNVLLDKDLKLGGFWKIGFEDTLGEYNIFVLMEKYLNDKGSNYPTTVAEGWDGDRVEFYINNHTDEYCLVWVSTWDSRKDAVEFFDAYVSLVPAKRGNSISLVDYNKSDNALWETEDGKNYSVKIINNDVYIMEEIAIESYEGVNELLLNSEIIYK